MTKITFVDNNEPALSASNLNTMQNNIETAITNATLTPQNTYNTSTTNVYSADYINNYVKGKVLFENNSGVSTGNIVLNESMLNYTRLKFYEPGGLFIGEVETARITTERARLMSTDQGATNTYFRLARLDYKNTTTFTITTNARVSFNGTTWSRDSGIGDLQIGKIIGYKY